MNRSKKGKNKCNGAVTNSLCKHAHYGFPHAHSFVLGAAVINNNLDMPVSQ